MRKLFVSFTGLIRSIKKGIVTQADLDTGLFYFGCAKVHVMEPSAHGAEANEINWFYGQNPQEGARVHATIVAAVEKAEAEGRAAWRSNKGGDEAHPLTMLLVTNGYWEMSHNRSTFDLSYPDIKRMVEKEELPLEVVL